MGVSLKMKWKQLVIGHFLTLVIGGVIYVSFRSQTLLMFRWFEKYNLEAIVLKIRMITGKNENIPNLIVYALPDGLWMFSYMSMILYLWDNQLKKENFLWVFGLPMIAIGSEIGQYFNLVVGTFDGADLLFYCLGILLPLLLYKVEIIKFKTKYI